MLKTPKCSCAYIVSRGRFRWPERGETLFLHLSVVQATNISGTVRVLQMPRMWKNVKRTRPPQNESCAHQQNGEEWLQENEQVTCQQTRGQVCVFQVVWTERGVLCCYGLYCSFAHLLWGHLLRETKAGWISGNVQSLRPALFFLFSMFSSSALVGSGFATVTFLLCGQVYFRHSYLHTRDDRGVWVTAERRLVLTWGGGRRQFIIWQVSHNNTSKQGQWI